MLRGDRIHEDDAPKPVTGVNLKTLPIGPQDAYVMSRVDGRTRVEQIALETGLDRGAVLESLSRLASVGAVTLPGRTASPAPPAEASPHESSPRASGGLGAPEGPIIRSVDDAPPVYDPSELDAPGEVSPERKKRILDVYYRLETATHYELLGLPRTAARNEVKSAYYELVGVFHPDKYFGKDLGAFRVKIEKAFERITIAHDVLSRKQARAEYDATLPLPRESERPPAFAPPPHPPHPPQERATPAPSPSHVPRAPSRVADAPDAPSSLSLEPPPLGSSSTSGERRISDVPLEDRRRLFARRFLSGTAPAVTSAEPVDSARLATEDLKRRYESSVASAGKTQLGRFLDQAAEAERAGDTLAAVNALRIAVSVAPDDKELAARLAARDQELATKVAGKYAEQGAEEERAGRFAEAAASFERALRGRPEDASLHNRAASCFLHTGKEHKRAAEHARRAVELAPNSSGYRITLARIYAAAGMRESALAELERAKTLAPADGTIKDLIKKVRRGDG